MEIATGAEARILENSGLIIKDRIKKEYRLVVIDEKLRSRRTKLEANLLREARRLGVLVPKVTNEEKYKIEMEKIDGKIVKDVLNSRNTKKIGEKIGKSIAILHEYNIIHGDLTTSNMIIKNDEVYFIDFGLGFSSQRIEDKATDLYLLYHSIEAAHWKVLKPLWKRILELYKTHFNEADKVIKALHRIEKRGRYK